MSRHGRWLCIHHRGRAAGSTHSLLGFAFQSARLLAAQIAAPHPQMDSAQQATPGSALCSMMTEPQPALKSNRRRMSSAAGSQPSAQAELQQRVTHRVAALNLAAHTCGGRPWGRRSTSPGRRPPQSRRPAATSPCPLSAAPAAPAARPAAPEPALRHMHACQQRTVLAWNPGLSTGWDAAQHISWDHNRQAPRQLRVGCQSGIQSLKLPYRLDTPSK